MSCTHPVDIPMLECCPGPQYCFQMIGAAMGMQVVSYTTADRTHYQSIVVRYAPTYPPGIPPVDYTCNWDAYTQTVISGTPAYAPVAHQDWLPQTHYLSVGGSFYGAPSTTVLSLSNQISESDILTSISNHVNAFDFDAVRADWAPSIGAFPGNIATYVSDVLYADSMGVGGTPNWRRFLSGSFNSLLSRFSYMLLSYPNCVKIRRVTSIGAYCPGFPITNDYGEPYSILTAAKVRVFNTGPIWSYQNAGLSFECSSEYPEGPVFNCVRNVPTQDPAGFEYVDFLVPDFIGSTSLDMAMQVCLP